MSENLCPKVNMSNEDWDPEVITRMIILGPGARVSESEIVGEFHMLGLPLTIKNTCYGSMISGKKDDVLKQLKKSENWILLTYSQKKGVLLQVILEDAGVIDLDLGKDSIKWKRNIQYLVMLLKL